MAHGRLTFRMPASAAVAFDAFHYTHWRAQWDSLTRASHVLDGAPCPYVGAITHNIGRGWLGSLSMRTQFVTFERPRLAAAAMIGRAFPFARWAASMRHEPLAEGGSLLIYTYTLSTSPAWLRWLIEPLVDRLFAWQTLRRFSRMQRFLQQRAADVEHWRREQASSPAATGPGR
jgi:hypothetical protein